MTQLKIDFDKKVCIVYASQTGQSKIIAELINDQLIENGYDPQLHCISKHDKDFSFNKITTALVMVCSTTGDGETPETAVRCYNKLKRLNTNDNKNYLANLKYALLGLGDTNYTQFCNGPKLFHKLFTELGAKCFYGPIWADDGIGLETAVEPFKEGLLDALKSLFMADDSTSCNLDHNENDLSLKINSLSIYDPKLSNSELTLPNLTDNHFELEYTCTNLEQDLHDSKMVQISELIHPNSTLGIFKASVVSNSLLTKIGSVKDCYNLKFKIDQNLIDGSSKSDHFVFEAGQAIDIICPNDSKEIEQLLKRLNIIKNADCQFKIKTSDESKKSGQTFVKLTAACNLSLRLFFRYCVDIRTNFLKKNFLRMLAEYCTDNNEKNRLLQLSSKEGSEDFLNLVKENSLSLLDLLYLFKSCQPPLGHLIQMLPSLNNRPYSLCSSNKNPDLEIIFNLVEFKVENSERLYSRLGLGTGYLSQLKEKESFYFLKRKFHTFTFPSIGNDKPIVMIGPGTGIAPFISFLRHVEDQHQENKSDLWLFYGCRDPSKDFLFKNELNESLVKYLSKFSVSFSRFYADKDSINEPNLTDEFVEKHHVPGSKYVQDSIKHYSKVIAKLIHDQDGFIYVCGDAKNMSKGVFNCLSECLSNECQISSQEADKYLNEMVKTKRYKQDIWA